MAMACEAARRRILDQLDQRDRTGAPASVAGALAIDTGGFVVDADQADRVDEAADAAALDAHVAGCAACAAFEARLLSLDAHLSEMFTPPVLSEGFRASLHTRIRRERRRVWMDALPEIVHVAGCGAVMGALALLAPPSAPLILSVGTMLALLTYVPLLALRNALDE